MNNHHTNNWKMLVSACLIFGFASMVKGLEVYNVRGVLQSHGEPHERITIPPGENHLDLTLGIKKIEYKLLSKIEGVTSVDVSRNLLKNTEFFVSLPRSTEIIVASESAIEDISEVDLGDLDRLSSIFLDWNKISSLSGEQLRNVEMLREISFIGNRITVIRSDFFTNLGKLTHLELEDNEILILEERVFVKLVNIESISLGKNNLTAAAVDMFGDHFPPTLKIFYVYGNQLPVVDEHVEIFGKSFIAPQPNSGTSRQRIANLADPSRTLEIVL